MNTLPRSLRHADAPDTSIASASAEPAPDAEPVYQSGKGCLVLGAFVVGGFLAIVLLCIAFGSLGR